MDTLKDPRRDPKALEASGAFVEPLRLEPLRRGPLDGLTFTVKDNIDIGGRRTSFGSPSWREAHPPAIHNALCVDQLLAAGATCVGKVVADEFTYSLDGENPFFGTPLNPKAPDRIPGGSSSGSASSVACGLADFSIGTDSGGSLRVPASLCGVWGMRPSLHRISEAGVLPFMPSVSTVGVLAADLDILERAMRVLLRSGEGSPARPRRIFALQDAFELADGPVREAAEEAAARLARRLGLLLERVPFSEIAGRDMTLVACNEAALRDLQTAEFESTVGDWIENHEPKLGPAFSMAYGNVRAFDRLKALESLRLCERLFESLNRFLGPDAIVCFPTTPTPAPRKGSLVTLEAVLDFYDRTMAVTSFSGVGRLPEISAPLLSVRGCPVGLSLAAAHYRDEFLLGAARELFAPPASLPTEAPPRDPASR
jgi:amidase